VGLVIVALSISPPLDPIPSAGGVRRSLRTLYVSNAVLVKLESARMPPSAGPPPGNPPVRRRSTRDRPAKAPLSEDAVVEAALTILQSEGLEAVTMRRVAQALDTGAASLYVYVSGREGLLQAMLDRVAATIELESPDPSRWRVQLDSLLQRMYQAFVDLPGVAALTLADPPTTETVLRVTENLLGILLAGGLDPQDAVWTCDLLVLLVTGVASEDDVRRARGGTHEDLREQFYKTFVGLPPERFPLLVAHAAEMVAGDVDERFRFAIDVVIDGVVARAARR
jgi:AcrR family transcriptional regulator